MKKLILPLLGVLLLAACEKENLAELNTVEPTYENDFVTTRGSSKVKLCHNGHFIEVSSNALAAHLDHGDEVEFGQIGTYEIVYRLNSTQFVHQGEITQSENGAFSGAGQSLTTGQTWTMEGTIDDDGNYSFTLYYTVGSYAATATGTFGCDGNGYSGNWFDSVNQSGTWSATYQTE